LSRDLTAQCGFEGDRKRHHFKVDISTIVVEPIEKQLPVKIKGIFFSTLS
jgi:hypothetical protein